MYRNLPVRKYKNQHAKWYFEGEAPKLTYPGGSIGGGKIGFGDGQKYKAQSFNKQLKKIVNKTIHKSQDIKSIWNGSTVTSITNERWQVLNPLSNIPIGTGDNARLSQDIRVKKITLRVTLESVVAGAPISPVTFRVIWIRNNLLVGSGSSVFNYSTITSSQIMREGQGTGSPIHESLDPSKCTVLSDKIFTVQPKIASSIATTGLVDISCPLEDFPFTYSSLTSNYSVKNKNIYCLITTYCPTSIGGTTNDGRVAYAWGIEFSDSEKSFIIFFKL